MPCVGGVCYRGANRPASRQRTTTSSRGRPVRGRGGRNTFGARSYPLGKGTVAQVPIYEPWQKQFQQAAIPMAQQQLQQLLGGELPTQGFEPIEQEALSNFERDVIPSIAERFAGLAGTQAPQIADVLGEARRQLAQNLAAQKAGFGQQQQQLRAGLLSPLLNAGLAPQWETSYTMPRPAPQYLPPPPQGGFSQGFGSGLGGLLGGVGSLIGSFLPGGGLLSGMSKLMR